MKYIIFLLLILAIIFLVIYYEKKLFYSRRQLLVANSQIDNLRKRVPKNTRKSNKLEIKFLSPNSTMGIINENSNVYIAPLEFSYLIQNISVKMEVRILDKAEANGTNWYYIALPLDSNINSRGWVNEKNFSYFYSSSKTVSKDIK